METRLYKRNDFPRGGDGGGEAKGREKESRNARLSSGSWKQWYSRTEAGQVSVCVRAGELRPTFVSWKTKLDPRTAVVDGWIFTTNRAVLNGGQGERVKPWKFLSAECLVFITRFSRKTLFPLLYGLSYPVKEREREREKRIRLRFHVQPRNNPIEAHPYIYIYILYTFSLCRCTVAKRKLPRNRNV